MNEQELKHALRDTMSAAPQPPSMNQAAVLDAAKRAHRQRRAAWAGAGSAVAVAAVAMAAMVIPGTGGGTPAAGGGQPTSPAVTGTNTTDVQTETSWPNGQTDRTATKGPEFEQGKQLLDRLTEVLPSGYQVVDEGELEPSHQAQFEDRVHGKEVWEYLAGVPVTRNGGYGEVTTLVETYPRTGDDMTKPCELTKRLWNMDGECEVVTVAGTEIGVVTKATRQQADQWAGYQHPDGTVVYIAQAKQVTWPRGKPALDKQVFTVHQLAELAMDPRFALK